MKKADKCIWRDINIKTTGRNISNFIEKVSRVRHLSLFERAPAAYVSGANFLS